MTQKKNDSRINKSGLISPGSLTGAVFVQIGDKRERDRVKNSYSGLIEGIEKH